MHQVLDLAAINRQLTGPNGSIVKDTLRRALRVQGRAKHLVSVDNGTLRDSIEIATETRLVEGVESMVVLVGTKLKYAMAEHEGTGIYGPTGAAILPVSGKFLVFKNKAGKLVFAKSVQGRPGTHFLKRALGEARG